MARWWDFQTTEVDSKLPSVNLGRQNFACRHIFRLLNRVVDLDEMLYGSDGIEYYLDSILFNLVTSTIPKWRTFKLLRWVQLLNRLVDSDEILYGGDGTEYCLL
jgi:hypothetical protein